MPGISAKHNAMVQLPQEQWAPCPRHSPDRQTTEKESAGDTPPRALLGLNVLPDS